MHNFYNISDCFDFSQDRVTFFIIAQRAVAKTLVLFDTPSFHCQGGGKECIRG